MYFDSGDWRTVGEGLPGHVRAVLQRFAETDERAATWLRPLLQPAGGTHSNVTKVRYQHPPFYAPDSDDGRRWSLLVDIELQDRSTPKRWSGDVPAPSGPRMFLLGVQDDAGLLVLQLDGSNAPILAATKRMGGIDKAFVREYLDFYGSFVTGERGPVAFLRPFPPSAKTDGTAHLGAHLLARAALELLPLSSAKGAGDLSEENLLERSTVRFVVGEIESEVAKLGPADWAHGLALWEVRDATLPHLAGGGAQTERLAKLVHDRTQAGEVLRAGIVRHGRHLFHVLLAVRTATGEVDTLEQRRIVARFGALPLESWRFVDPADTLAPGRRLEWSPRPGEHEHPKDFLDRWHAPPEKAGRALLVGGGRVMFRVDLRGATLHGPVAFEDVDFHEDVDLSDAVIERGVTFRGCRFLGSLWMRNTRIRGPLILEDCVVSGLRDRTQVRSLRRMFERTGSLGGVDETVAIGLGGMTIDGDLRIRRVRAFGTVSVRGTRVSGRAHLSGSSIWPFNERPAWLESGEAPLKLRLGVRFADRGAALDLRNARFEQGLSLSASFGAGGRPLEQPLLAQEACEPMLVVGAVRAEHVYVGASLEIGGLVCGALAAATFDRVPEVVFSGRVSLADAHVVGQLQSWSSSEGPNDAWRYLRTVCTHLDLSRAHFGAVDLRGVHLEGHLSGHGLDCGGVVDLSPVGQHWIEALPDNAVRWTAPHVGGRLLVELPSDALRPDGRTLARFGRTHIGGYVDLRASTIAKDLYLDGVYVGRDVQLNDAEIGGLSFSVHLSALLGVPDGELNPLLVDEPSTRAVRTGPVGHLDRNVIAVSTAKVGEGKGLVILCAQAQRLVLQDATVHGPVKVAGGVLLGPNTVEEARSRLRVVRPCEGDPPKGPDRFRGLDGAAVLAARDEGIKRHDDVLVVTNSTIDGPLLLYREGLISTLVDRILRSPQDEDAFRALAGADGFEHALKARLREWLPRHALHARLFGGVRVHETKIDGQLELRESFVDGRVQVVDVSLTSDLNAGVPLGKDWKSVDKSIPLFAHEVNLEALRTTGDVVLNGIVTHQVVAPNMSVEGGIDFRDVSVQGNANLSGTRCDSLSLSTSETGTEGLLDLQRCVIDLLAVQDRFPFEIDLRTSTVRRLERTGHGTSYNMVRKLLTHTRIKVDAKVYAMLESLLRNEGDHWGADRVRVLMHSEQGRVAWGQLWAVNPDKRKWGEWVGTWRAEGGLLGGWEAIPRFLSRMWEYGDRKVLVVSGWFGRAAFLTLLAGALTVFSSLVVSGTSANYTDMLAATAQDATLVALETGFPPFSRGEGDESRVRLRDTGVTYVGVDLFTSHENGGPWAGLRVSPWTMMRVLRACGWVMWTWFVLLATGLMRRGGGTVSD